MCLHDIETYKMKLLKCLIENGVFQRTFCLPSLVSNFLSLCPFSKLIYIINGESCTGLLTTPKSQSVFLYQILYRQIGAASHLQAWFSWPQTPWYLLEAQHRGMQAFRRFLEYTDDNFPFWEMEESMRRGAVLDFMLTMNGLLGMWRSKATMAAATMRWWWNSGQRGEWKASSYCWRGGMRKTASDCSQ